MKYKFIEKVTYMVDADSIEEATALMGEENYSDYETDREMGYAKV